AAGKPQFAVADIDVARDAGRAGEYQHAEVGLYEVAHARQVRRDRCGISRTAQSSVADADDRLRRDERDVIAADQIAVARELHPRRGDRTERAIDAHRAAQAGKDRKRVVGEGSIGRTVIFGPIVVTAAVLPQTVAAGDHAVVLAARRAIPEAHGEPGRVDQI